MDIPEGMKAVLIPEDSVAVVYTATAEAEVIKAADIAAANENKE